MSNPVTPGVPERPGPGATPGPDTTGEAGRRPTIDIVNASLGRRYRAERRFRFIGMSAVVIGLAFVAVLFADIIGKGYSAFQQTYIRLTVDFSAEVIDPEGRRDPAVLRDANYLKLARDALAARFPEVTRRADRQALYGLLSPGAPQQLMNRVLADPGIIGTTQEVWVLADDDADMFMKGRSTPIAIQRGVGLASLVPVEGGEDNQVQVLSTAKDFSLILRDLADYREKGRAPASNPGSATESVPTPESDLAGQEVLGPDLPSHLVAINGGLIKVERATPSGVTGTLLKPLTTDLDAQPGQWATLRFATPENDRRLKDLVVAWLYDLTDTGDIEKRFNTGFFTQGASREPELAGIAGALMGSFYTLALTLLLSFPVGVGAALYLEEFAPRNWFTDLIEVNINNLAAVPSIIFGLLGLAVFINFFGIPRSTPLVGALVLTFMTLATIIIASRSALQSVPPSIREAALGVGASPLQTQFHHVLPLAIPGMLTGAILGMARALGETAPLLMIGMVAFIVDTPTGFLSPATVLPVQVYLWADSPEVGFVERTSAAILVLLAFLAVMNLAAVLLRRKFERRW
jgi:phosphate transport system permease protein